MPDFECLLKVFADEMVATGELNLHQGEMPIFEVMETRENGKKNDNN